MIFKPHYLLEPYEQHPCWKLYQERERKRERERESERERERKPQPQMLNPKAPML